MYHENEIPESSAVRSKVLKRIYPTQNNNNILDFVFPRDKNLYLRKNNIVIKGSIAIDKDYITEVGFVSKLFSMLTVEVDSQVISNNRAK